MRTRDAVIGVLVALAWGFNVVAIGEGLREVPAALFAGLLVIGTHRADPAGVVSLLYIVVVATLGGYGAWYWLLGRYDSSSVAAFPLLAPIAALSSAWLVLGEAFGAVQLVGSGLVVGGVADAIRAGQVQRASSCAATLAAASRTAVRAPGS